MNVQQKIEKWCKDEKFLQYANKRMNEEISDVPENHRLDAVYEELDEGFEWDDRYALPLATYLTCRLQVAKLQRNAKKRRRGIWWVFTQVAMQGHYVQVFSEEFSRLLTELQETVMPMLYTEYIQNLNSQRR